MLESQVHQFQYLRRELDLLCERGREDVHRLQKQLHERADAQAVEDRYRYLVQQFNQECMMLRGRVLALQQTVMNSDTARSTDGDRSDDEPEETTSMLVQRLILKLNTCEQWILEQDAATRDLRAALGALREERDRQLLLLQAELQDLWHMGAQIVSFFASSR